MDSPSLQQHTHMTTIPNTPLGTIAIHESAVILTRDNQNTYLFADVSSFDTEGTVKALPVEGWNHLYMELAKSLLAKARILVTQSKFHMLKQEPLESKRLLKEAGKLMRMLKDCRECIIPELEDA